MVKKREWQVESMSSRKAGSGQVAPKAFTEKGLYMLATILKSKRATVNTMMKRGMIYE